MSGPWHMPEHPDERDMSAEEEAAELRRLEAFSAEDIEDGISHPGLGPSYFAARKIADAFMEPFAAEHFKPLIDKFASEFRDQLWGDLETFLLADTESNLHLSLWRMVDGTINALLTGEAWALQRYVIAAQRYGDAPKVRAAIVEQCREQLAEQRIADLELELERAKEDARRARGEWR
jgi:hypothetical protein